MYVVLTKKYIELRFLLHEQMIFFDEIEKLNKLLESFFKGKYEVEIYRNEKGESIYKQIKWLSKDLEVFNEKYNFKRTTKDQSVEKLKGIDLIH